MAEVTFKWKEKDESKKLREVTRTFRNINVPTKKMGVLWAEKQRGVPGIGIPEDAKVAVTMPSKKKVDKKDAAA